MPAHLCNCYKVGDPDKTFIWKKDQEFIGAAALFNAARQEAIMLHWDVQVVKVLDNGKLENVFRIEPSAPMHRDFLVSLELIDAQATRRMHEIERSGDDA